MLRCSAVDRKWDGDCCGHPSGVQPFLGVLKALSGTGIHRLGAAPQALCMCGCAGGRWGGGGHHSCCAGTGGGGGTRACLRPGVDAGETWVP